MSLRAKRSNLSLTCTRLAAEIASSPSAPRNDASAECRRAMDMWMRRRHAVSLALVPRTRSSHHIAAGTGANFGFKSGTRIIALLVSFSIPKFAQKSRQMLANFGIGTLAMAVLFAAVPARAEYPERPVRILEPFPPGGAVD